MWHVVTTGTWSKGMSDLEKWENKMAFRAFLKRKCR